tara:strand:- start:1962 stop:2165 length:204 start_codon:yes stop_codon:yes gene_type:complete
MNSDLVPVPKAPQMSWYLLDPQDSQSVIACHFPMTLLNIGIGTSRVPNFLAKLCNLAQAIEESRAHR